MAFRKTHPSKGGATPSIDDRIADLRAAGIELIAGSLTDLAGVTRAKYVPLRRLGDFQRSGMGVSPS